jgi:CheY-like chemotaxis protein
MRTAVQAAATRWSATYAEDATPSEPPANSRRVLVLNLLGPGAIQWIRDQSRLHPRRASAFTYAFDCGRGVILGTLDYLPVSMDIRADVEHYMEHQTARRILIVGGDFDVVSHLQESLGRHNCTTATALNSKQALDLVPTIRPELVMLDMRLPRESSVRLAHHLRNNVPGLRNLPVTFFWRERADLVDFNDQTQNAIREPVLTPDEVGRALSLVINPAAVNG